MFRVFQAHIFPYPSIDSLRLEDNQPDPYLLFTIKDQSGSVVRHLKAPAKKGLQRMVWDFRYGTPASVTNRSTPAPDQLFGGTEDGHLAMPGQYTVTLSKYEDGNLMELTSPVTFTCKLLEHSSIPTDMSANVNFYRKVSDLRKAVIAANDLFKTMNQRVRNIHLAIHDMPAQAKDLLEQAHAANQKLISIRLKLLGDQTRSQREFEIIPSINDRVSGIEGSVWNSTAPIPKIYTESYTVAAKQFALVLTDMRKVEADILKLEKELEVNGAPYTPGRWPDWNEK